ncbi:hypothetical protein BDN71DRAFT_1405122 [Pleurotus eryngii]|uniref:Uncharacterized protein n=1 Tax=Pleurotus eryngii TaxID=5323 RepID=A0A9P5ZFL3_PLEER|nr:hypothetical protein BDN71DRAFT_1405122 [Pleurotus eryngii]
MKLPPSDITPPKIHTNPKLYPFLKGCLGALDGTHIDALYHLKEWSRSTNTWLAPCPSSECC